MKTLIIIILVGVIGLLSGTLTAAIREGRQIAIENWENEKQIIELTKANTDYEQLMISYLEALRECRKEIKGL